MLSRLTLEGLLGSLHTMPFFGQCRRSLTQLFWSNSIRPSSPNLFRTCRLRSIGNLADECRLVLEETIEHFIVVLLRGLFIEALDTLVQEILELVASDLLDAISDTILDTIGNIGLAMVSIIRHLIRIVVATIIVTVPCCMDIAVGSLRISMCLVDICFDVIEVLLGRFRTLDSGVFPILHVGVLSLLVLFVTSQ